jgi:hypothetical protein
MKHLLGFAHSPFCVLYPTNRRFLRSSPAFMNLSGEFAHVRAAW